MSRDDEGLGAKVSSVFASLIEADEAPPLPPTVRHLRKVTRRIADTACAEALGLRYDADGRLVRHEFAPDELGVTCLACLALRPTPRTRRRRR